MLKFNSVGENTIIYLIIKAVNDIFRVNEKKNCRDYKGVQFTRTKLVSRFMYYVNQILFKA